MKMIDAKESIKHERYSRRAAASRALILKSPLDIESIDGIPQIFDFINMYAKHPFSGMNDPNSVFIVYLGQNLMWVAKSTSRSLQFSISLLDS